MGFMQQLFGRGSSTQKREPDAQHSRLAAFPPSQFAASQLSRAAAETPQAVRKELLRLVLRETLSHNGIPIRWVGADALVATSSSGRATGIHVRLLVKHWDARLLACGMAFQQNFESRLLALDPQAATWLMGMSWQYALPPEAEWPPLPPPAEWADEHDTLSAWQAPRKPGPPVLSNYKPPVVDFAATEPASF